jgi:hypothetical protein
MVHSYILNNYTFQFLLLLFISAVFFFSISWIFCNAYPKLLEQLQVMHHTVNSRINTREPFWGRSSVYMQMPSWIIYLLGTVNVWKGGGAEFSPLYIYIYILTKMDVLGLFLAPGCFQMNGFQYIALSLCMEPEGRKYLYPLRLHSSGSVRCIKNCCCRCCCCCCCCCGRGGNSREYKIGLIWVKLMLSFFPFLFSPFFDRLCGLVVRVHGYIKEMYCVSCEVRTEFIYVM